MLSKNVLVTGGSGFIATNLINALLDKGYKVRATLHKNDPQIKWPGVEFINTDLTSKIDCAGAVNGMEWVFMFAANTSGAAVIEKTPLVHLTPNLIMNTLMLEAAYDAGVKKFLFPSSNTVYPALNRPVKEEDAVWNEMFSKYFIVGWMKRFTEIMCQMYSEKIKKPMTTIVVRPANAYGPYDDFNWKTSHVLPALIRRVVERHSPIEVWGDGKDVKDLIFVEDFVEGAIAAMEKNNSFQIINIGTGKGISVKHALNEIIKADGYKDAQVVFDASKPSMIPFRILDISKAKKELGFTAKTSFARGIKKTIRWFRNASLKLD